MALTKIWEKRAKVVIRGMRIDDLPEVFHLGESLFTRDFLPLLYRTWDEYEVTSLFSNNSELCLVAERSGKIVGFAMGTTVEKAGSPWKYGYLVWLGVEKAYQNRGIGKKLYREMERRMLKLGARMIITDTDESNEPAISFFEKMGFSKARGHLWLSKTLKRRQREKKGGEGEGEVRGVGSGGSEKTERGEEK
ncbi:GNAT family N-acetyltransferase [Candidatus Bathyarchaeota archaeon]|nr:GNAT family N-acetyltransferase [Candidatus Bathyarchaeota archaeon]MBS7627491.1 GNAT family N-acetyltransferase [Candidatus Bathyarchaeota archaeon]